MVTNESDGTPATLCKEPAELYAELGRIEWELLNYRKMVMELESAKQEIINRIVQARK